MIDSKQTKIMAIVVVAILVIAAVAAVVITNQNDSKSQSRDADTKFTSMSWADIVKEANGQTVNWYLWDGDVNVNSFIDNEVSTEAAKYGITINRIGIASPHDIVVKVNNEIAAGKTTGGSVDLAWLNGTNFSELKANGNLFGHEWAWTLPNTTLVNWNVSSIASDMGVAVDGYESPWGTAEFQLLFHATSDMKSVSFTNFSEFYDWCVGEGSGKFTYSALNGNDSFYGLAFLKSLLYELDNDGSGGWTQYSGSEAGYMRYTSDKWANKTESDFEKATEYLWAYLEGLSSHMYTGDGDYPVRSVINNALVNNQINVSFTYASAGTSAEIKSGVLPSGTSPVAMKTGVADTNYVMIPSNANSKAAAMVVANILLEPVMQAKWLTKTGNNVSINEDQINTDVMKDRYHENLVRDEGTYLTPQQIADSSQPDVTSGNVSNWLIKIWEKRIAAKG